MTDPHDGPPLTRRERRERERAAERAAQGLVDDAGQPTEDSDEAAQAAATPPPVQAPPATPFPSLVPRDDATEFHDDDLPRRRSRDEVRSSQAAPSAPSRPSVPSPSAAVGGHDVRFDDVQLLDDVDDEAIDAVEIDDVSTPDVGRISARDISDATPAELEDRRVLVDEPDIEAVVGPTRRSGRAPVIVQVVQDASAHHLSDLRADSEQLESVSVGTGSTSITANALVLPGAGDDSEITATDGEVIITGSVPIQDGIARSGRGSRTLDGADLDEADSGDVANPGAQPVRASKAVSSYDNARVRIAPQKRSSSAVPVAIGVGAGVVVAGVFGVVLWAMFQGLF